MARDKNTYAKRQRETLKRQKAEAKQERRRKRKQRAHGHRGRRQATGGPPRACEPKTRRIAHG